MSNQRLGVSFSLLGSKPSLACYIAAILMRMFVNSCASERNWSRWGLVFTPNRNLLGLEHPSWFIFTAVILRLELLVVTMLMLSETKLADSGMAKCLYHHKSPFEAKNATVRHTNAINNYMIV